MKNNLFDSIIIGGSYAGLSAAMALGRSLRKTLIIDSGTPCNRFTPRSHNFLTQDGKTPKEISEIARYQVKQYDAVNFYNDTAVTGNKTIDGFEIITKSGEIFRGRKLIFATGVKDTFPNITGFAESWGISVIHCPYCHGYEYRHKKTAIFGDGNKAIHLAMLVRNLTANVTLLTHGESQFTTEQLHILSKNNIQIIRSKLMEIHHTNGYLHGLSFEDGTFIDMNVLYANVSFEQQTGIPLSLGCEFTELGHLKIDNFNRTSVDEVFACGDNSSPLRSISHAVASGQLAGAFVNMELADEDFTSGYVRFLLPPKDQKI